MARLISALLVLILCTATLAQKAPTTAPAKAGDLPAVNFNGVAFKDAIDYIADISGANMIVNWKALEQANVLPDTQITLKVGGVTVRKALELLLRQAGGETPLTYTVDDGVVEITTQAAADSKLVTRTYGIQDLLFEAQDFTNAPQLSLTGSGSGGGGGGGRGGGRGGGGGGGGNTLFGGTGTQTTGTGANATGMTQKERADEIIKMITTTIRPEIWQENGGPGKISFYRGNLIITAPLSVHRLIG